MVVRLGGIGDALLATAIVPALENAFPGSRIDVICCRAAESAFRGNPGIDRTFSSPVLDAMDFRELAGLFSLKELARIREFLDGAEIVFHLNKIASVGGSLLYMMLALISRRSFHVGRDTGGRGFYLDHRVPDAGYLLKHEIEVVKLLLDDIGLGLHREAVRPILQSGAAERDHVDRLLPAALRNGFMVIHPGSSGKGWRVLKRISIEVWKEFIGHVLDHTTFGVVLVGANDDKALSDEIVRLFRDRKDAGSRVLDITGKTSLVELYEVISRAKAFVGTDSGVAHVAGCTDTPGAVVFTFSDYIGYRPWNKHIEIVRKDIPSSPCIYWGGYLKCPEKECGEITSADILAGLRKNIDL